MGFEVLNRRASRASGIAVNVTKNPKAKEGHGLSGFFRIAPDVIKEAGWNDPENTKVQILMGNGEDTGMFILQPSAEGRTTPFKPKAGASLQLSFSAMSAGFTAPTEGTQEVEYELDGNAIKITVPSLRASAPEAPAPEAPTTTVKKTAKKS